MTGTDIRDLACVKPDPQGRVLPPLDEQGLGVMHGKKTGALIRASAAAGAIMGGGAPSRSTRSIAPPASSVSPFRSSTTSSTSKAHQPNSARPQARMPRPASPPTRSCTVSMRRAGWRANAWPARRASSPAANLADARLLGIGRWIVESRSELGSDSGSDPGSDPQSDVAWLAYHLISYCSIGSWRRRANGRGRWSSPAR